MAKSKTVYLCSECGADFSKWQGKCPACGAWNTLAEYGVQEVKTASAAAAVRAEGRPQRLSEITGQEELRISTGIGELDRVLGGGMVKGSLLLVSGEPGIGKSTLLLQACASLCSLGKVLYVTGEESLPQIKLRAARLEIEEDDLFIYAQTQLDDILSQTGAVDPQVLIIDSVQTIYNPDLPSTPGSVTQVRECTMALMRYAKVHGVTVILVGHVNKDGVIAGPKVLEHMVDTVLSFEGDRHVTYRILKGTKNRFGSTSEIGVFEMSEQGLLEVTNPSEALLSGRPADAHGSCVAATMEGTRPILAEIQALVTKSAYGASRRTASGVDYNRAVLIMAILEKRAGFMLGAFDAYINVVGGLSLDEPAVDLAVLLAISSSYLERPIGRQVAAFGEVGLSGEIRAVSGGVQRLAELKRLGFEKCIVPRAMEPVLKDCTGIEVVYAADIAQAIKASIAD